DLVAVASHSGVTFSDPVARRDPAFVRLADPPRALAFSPSGHRIYVARRSAPGLAVIDRYDRREVDGVALPGPAAALRVDPLGRWLLARPTVGEDRKSTRLNSSHVAISYAVFCLKKKNCICA